ncbi:PepSY domain-containing protein [Peribacillus sp. NPDC101480]|uniref:PepSY domain-containing protein n=1 Tax=Peribacillus sp. NPDC101480 TaxID=3390620 RepID=UPI003D06987E
MYDNYYNNQTPLYRQRLTMQQAQEIALQRVPGQVLHSDMEHGVLVYEFFILTNQNRIYEVEINAKTGKIMKVEEEDLD